MQNLLKSKVKGKAKVEKVEELKVEVVADEAPMFKHSPKVLSSSQRKVFVILVGAQFDLNICSLVVTDQE